MEAPKENEQKTPPVVTSKAGFCQKKTSVHPAPEDGITTRLSLLKRESNDFMHSPAVCTITFFEGDITAASSFLKNRISEVLALNPWLGGKLDDSTKKIELVYPTEPISVNQVLTVLTEPVKDIQMNTEYESLMKACIPLSVKANGWKQFEAKEIVSKFVIVPTSAKDSDTPGFAFIFSLSHTIADGHTYYEILNMLSDNPSTVVRALNTARKPEYEEVYLNRLVTPQVLQFYYSLTLMKSDVMGMFRKPASRVLAYFIDEEKVNQTKKEFNSSPESFVSTNDVVTSHFMNACSPRLGMMAINYRGRCPILEPNDAGNYEDLLLSDCDSFKTPAAVRASLNPTAEGAYTGLNKPLPGFFEKLEYATITSWALKGTNPPFDLSTGGCKQLLHLPIFFLPVPVEKCPSDTAILFRPLPNKLALLVFAKKANSENLFAGNHPFGKGVHSDIFPLSSHP
jgi:hypothetical protein